MNEPTKTHGSERYFTHLAVRVKALSFRDNIPGFVKYVRENREYFKELSDDDLDKISKNNEISKN
jgi:hypothetical protein